MSHPFQPEKAIREAREQERRTPESGLVIEIISEIGIVLNRLLAGQEDTQGSLTALHGKADQIMTDQDTLNQAVAGLGDDLTALSANFAAELAALEAAQNANPAAPLDFTGLQNFKTSLDALVTTTAPAAPPAQGTGADVPPAG